MKNNELNVYLDFDKVQFDGSLNTAILRFLNYYKDNNIEGLTKEQLMEELKSGNSAEFSPNVKEAVNQALDLERLKSVEEKTNISYDFFEGSALNEFVGEYIRKGANISVLVATDFPKVIRYLYQKNGLSNFDDVQVLSVPFENDRKKSAVAKNQKIFLNENKHWNDEDCGDLISVLYDDSKFNIEEFTTNPGRDAATTFGKKVDKNGLTKAYLDEQRSFLNNIIDEYSILPKTGRLGEKVILEKKKVGYEAIDEDFGEQEIYSEVVDKEKLMAKDPAGDSNGISLINAPVNKNLSDNLPTEGFFKKLKKVFANNESTTEQFVSNHSEFKVRGADRKYGEVLSRDRNKAVKRSENHGAVGGDDNHVTNILSKFMDPNNVLNPQMKKLPPPTPVKPNKLKQGEAQNTSKSKGVPR